MVDGVDSLGFANGDRLLVATYTWRGVRAWHIESVTKLREVTVNRRISVKSSSSRHPLIVATGHGDEQTLVVYNIETGRSLKVLEMERTPTTFEFVPNGESFLSGGPGEGGLKKWDLRPFLEDRVGDDQPELTFSHLRGPDVRCFFHSQMRINVYL